jgi:hypothetical protein
MMSLMDRIDAGYRASDREDLAELDRRISVTEALLAGLKETRRRMLPRVLGSCVVTAAPDIPGLEVSDAVAKRIEEDGSEPALDYSDCF